MNAPEPAMQLFAQVGTVTRHGEIQTGPSVDGRVIRVSEVRVLPSGWLALIKEVGLRDAGMLLTVAQLSVVIDGEIVCHATNEELALITGMSRNSVGTIIGRADGTRGGLCGRGFVAVRHNQSGNLRSAGRRVYLDPSLYRLGSESVDNVLRPPNFRAHADRAHDSCAHDGRLHDFPAHDRRSDGTTTDSVTERPTAVRTDSARTGTSEPAADAEIHQKEDLIAELLKFGFRGARDAVERYPHEVIVRSLRLVEERRNTIVDTGAYLNRVMQAGGPAENEMHEPSRAQPAALPPADPYAPPPPWPLDWLDAQQIATVEQAVSEQLPPQASPYGRLWEATCRSLASEMFGSRPVV